MTLTGLLIVLVSVAAAAPGDVEVRGASTHFAREKVLRADPNGQRPDERRRKRAQQEAQSDADKLEGALPRLRDSLTGARALVPLDTPNANRQRLDLNAERTASVEVAFGEPVTAPEVEALVRALAAELQIRTQGTAGAEVRRWVGTGTFVVVVASVAAALWLGRRRRGRAATQ